MMGHIIEWYYNGLAGIQPLKPGFRQVRITPWMPDCMDSLSCRYKTPLGTICVEGHRENGNALFDVTVPEGIELVG